MDAGPIDPPSPIEVVVSTIVDHELLAVPEIRATRVHDPDRASRSADHPTGPHQNRAVASVTTTTTTPATTAAATIPATTTTTTTPSRSTVPPSIVARHDDAGHDRRYRPGRPSPSRPSPTARHHHGPPPTTTTSTTTRRPPPDHHADHHHDHDESVDQDLPARIVGRSVTSCPSRSCRSCYELPLNPTLPNLDTDRDNEQGLRAPQGRDSSTSTEPKFISNGFGSIRRVR